MACGTSQRYHQIMYNCPAFSGIKLSPRYLPRITSNELEVTKLYLSEDAVYVL